MFRRRKTIDLNDALPKSQEFRCLKMRVGVLECEMEVAERLHSPLHCKCGRYVGVWVTFPAYYPTGYRWYDRGEKPGLLQVVCLDCLTECSDNGAMRQLQRKGKAK